MAKRHKQQEIGHFGTFRHSVHGYKVYGCRCAVCKQAMSDYGKSRYVPKAAEPIAAPTRSWWTDAPADHFTAFVEREQAARMKSSRFGGSIKPYTTEEVSR